MIIVIHLTRNSNEIDVEAMGDRVLLGNTPAHFESIQHNL